MGCCNCSISRELTQLAMTERKQNGWIYSTPPFGFNRRRNKLIENKREQQILNFIFRWRSEGYTLQYIADQLTKMKVKTKKGGKWWPCTVKYILENDLYRTI